MKIVLFLNEGKHEMGGWKSRTEYSCQGQMPSLPRLVQRLLGREDVQFVWESFRDVDKRRGKGNSWAKKVDGAIRHAVLHEFDAAVVMVDNDGDKADERRNPMRQERDELCNRLSKPHYCALAIPVEAFDAWMIVDPDAIAAAGGDKYKACHSPERLRQPKSTADNIFGTRDGLGLGPKYRIVAERVSLDLLRQQCPLGFQPFAQDVQTIAR